MEGIEFWIVTVEDTDGLHGSEIVWGDGLDPADAIKQFRKDWADLMVPGYYPEGCDIIAHGPYQTNGAATA